tara:strand:- start:463 stop:822 length:360 start_codon:yes stop_codon:yes gene_type:complete
MLVLYGLLLSFCLTLWAVLKIRRGRSKNALHLDHEESQLGLQTGPSKDLTILRMPRNDQGSNQISMAQTDFLEKSSRTSDAETDDLGLGQAKRIKPRKNSWNDDAFERFLRGDRDGKGF